MNLEWVTYRENNRHYRESNEYTSKYFGVCFNKKSQKWEAAITNKGKQYGLGHFVSEYEAHLAYEKALALMVSEV